MTQLSWIGLWLESISFVVSLTIAVSLTSHCKNHITCIFLLFLSPVNGITKQFPSLFAPFNQKESALLAARELTIDTLLLDSHHPAARTSMAACPYRSGPPGHPHRSPVKRSNDSRRKNHLGEATQAVNWLASQSHIMWDASMSALESPMLCELVSVLEWCFSECWSSRSFYIDDFEQI